MSVPKTLAKANIPLFKPTARQEKPIREGMSFLAMTAAFWSNILYGELEVVYTTAVPMAGTDSHRVFFNPDAIAKLNWTVENMAFVHAHEVYHYIRGDLIMAAYWHEVKYVTFDDGTSLPYHHGLMNCAMDYVINAGLIKAGIGDFPKGHGLFDPKYSADGMNSSIDLYRVLYNEAKRKGSMGSSMWGEGHGNFDVHVEPSDEVIEEEKYGNGKEKRELAIASAAQAAALSQQGDLPGFIKRMLGDIMNPKVRWEENLQATMARAGGEPGHNWAQVNKRMISRNPPISFARRIAKGCGTLVIGGDTSGSTVMALDRFFAEMAGIVAQLQPRELYVMWCDTQVHRIDHIEEPEDLVDLHRRVNTDGGPGGGGGSNMAPIFDKIAEMGLQPDMLVVLTDLYVSFPKQEPTYTTIWASVSKNKKAPFGKVIEIEL